MTTQEQIESFYRFATERLTIKGFHQSIDEIYEQWRSANTDTTSEEYALNVAAIQASLDDIENGETGRDADEFIEEMRKEMGCSDPK